MCDYLLQKVIITGDLALTAASVMSHRLDTLTARQLLAIDVHQVSARIHYKVVTFILLVCDLVEVTGTHVNVRFSLSET